MKRSEINVIIREADAFIRSFGYVLPPFAYWSPQDLLDRRSEIGGIVGPGLGWDITDFGQGNFAEMGLFLFTVRNGSLEDLRHGGGMCYAEKIMMARKDQVTPLHRHIVKAEDIINRGGGTLALKLFNSDEDGQIDRTSEVVVACDGVQRRQEAGAILRLSPGESVTLMPGNWHGFWGEDSDVLVGEVSTVNNDATDNIFAKPVGRFAEIEEDEEPLYLLVSDYPRWFG